MSTKQAIKLVILLGSIFSLSSDLMAQNRSEREFRRLERMENRQTRTFLPLKLAVATRQQNQKEEKNLGLFDRSPTNKAEAVAKAMGLVETGGTPKRGASGEACTIWQWLPSTWRVVSCQYNEEVNGVPAPLTLSVQNEEKVVVWKCQTFLDQGYSPKEIGMIWNTSLGGVEKPLVRKGVNKHGVRFDSNHHGNKVQRAFDSL